MLSKQVTKIVQNLEKKKFREKYNLFKIEGEKLVGELLHSPLKIHSLIAFPSWLEQNKKALSNVNIIEADEREMHGISNFQSLPEVIALAEIPVHIYRKEEVLDSLSLVLNGIQDPGNLGTILRVADWFGIGNIFCDADCAGVYNPKCVQASMGHLQGQDVLYGSPCFIERTEARRPSCLWHVFRWEKYLYDSIKYPGPDRHGERRKRNFSRNRSADRTETNDSEFRPE